ncbi:NfeD family protein [Gimesia sp.]|uniref:NfeD family protein n=1 Tax=Gimesia sp. TaxID=2024833 RepID=UPI003A948F1D
MDYSLLAILALIVALLMLVAEIFLPSGGIIAILALTSIAGSVWAAWMAWWGTSPGLWWTYIASVIVLIPTTLGFAVRIFPNTAWGKKVIHEVPTLDEVTGFREETEHLRSLIGKIGKTQTLLNPSGFVLVNHERHHCESQGMIVDAQVDVEIIAVEGTRLVVKVVKPPVVDETKSGEKSAASDERAGDESFDFEVPEN